MTELVYVALVSMFVIGVIAGGMAVLFFRRMIINRQLRVAQRKSSRLVAEARHESDEILNEAKKEAERIPLMIIQHLWTIPPAIKQKYKKFEYDRI